jgi:LPS-assembly protein
MSTSTGHNNGSGLFRLLVCEVVPPNTSLYIRLTICVCIWLATAHAQAQPRLDDFQLLQTVPDKVHIEAEELLARGKDGPVLLTGGVWLKGKDIDIRAEWVEIFPDQDRIVLAGSVKVVEGNSVMLSERLELNRKTSRAVIRRAIILVKKDVAPNQLPAYVTSLGLITAGRNVFTLQGTQVVKDKDRWDVSGARFTACDCGDQAPSWEIRACKADIIPEERAWLTWPVLYLKGLPVFAAPVAYLPLSNRRTGLLFPQLNYSGRDGVVLSESLFITLGRSADTTLTGDWFEERGFRERLEFRARPSHNSLIETRFMYIYDEKVAEIDSKKHLRHRYSAELDAWLLTRSKFSLNASVRLYSDSDINRDFVSDMAGRAADYAPSTVGLGKAGQDYLLTLDAAYLQDLRFGGVDLFGDQVDAIDRQKTHDTIQRLGALSFYLAPVGPQGWPFLFSVTAEGANLSSLSQAYRDWGFDGTPDQKEASYIDAPVADKGVDNGPGGEADGLLSDGELRRAFRFMLEPELSFPFQLGKFLQLQARLSHRQLAYLPHGPKAPDNYTCGISFAHLRLATELSRSFGEGTDKIGHVITPWLQLAGAWRGLTSQGPRPYLDVNDRLHSDAQQLLVGFNTGLYRSRGKLGFSKFVGLSITQAVDLAQVEPGQAAVEMDFNWSPFFASTMLGYDWQSNKLAEVDLALRFIDRRGDRVSLSYLYLPSVRDSLGRPLPLSERVQRERGLLFGITPEYFRALGETIHVLQGTAVVAIAWGLSLNAGASLDLREKKMAWYQGGLSYNSDCDCWGFSLTVRMIRNQDYPDVFFLLDLAYLGSAGVGSNTRF